VTNSGEHYTYSTESQPEIPLSSRHLHEITAQMGVWGLETRFEMEVDALGLDPDTRQSIADAKEIAMHAHDGDTRGPHPYSTHFLRVATRIIYYFQVGDPDIIIAALLHDTVEDHPERLIDKTRTPLDILRTDQDFTHAALDFIGHRFNERTARLVASVTNPPFDPTKNKNLQYYNHIVTSLTQDPEARIIKLSDFIENCNGLRYSEDPPQRVRKRALKYAPLIPYMRLLALATDTPLPVPGREYILERLERGEALCNTLLRTSSA
jgi:(p)ppGpp synthase/HD superfamily hydrolase